MVSAFIKLWRNRMFKQLTFTALLALTALTGGCASVKMADESQDAQAKTFQVAPDKAHIYVYRNESMGAGVKMPVALNGKPVGQTVAKSYLMLSVPAGQQTLVSSAENDSELKLTAEAGKNYFVWQEVKVGFIKARNSLQLVDDQTGRAGVAESKLIQAQ
ncbi:DUF2846 domain-containing protein [Pseudomonas laurylsulfatiphila]|uniref:DUF2846 domain-containing protein n=1 Tax=Pseudomonas laurylsulfatiphila TaxID=2011015 RepID=UPI003D1E2179